LENANSLEKGETARGGAQEVEFGWEKGQPILGGDSGKMGNAGLQGVGKWPKGFIGGKVLWGEDTSNLKKGHVHGVRGW